MYRLAGSAIFDLFQRELRGLEWLTLFSEETRPVAQSCAESVLSEGQVGVIRAEGRTARHRTVPLEILLLPLATEAEESRRALGSIVACDRPYWLGAQPLVELAVLNGDVVTAGDGSAAPGQSPTAKTAEFPWRGPIRRLRHLALYLGSQDR